MSSSAKLRLKPKQLGEPLSKGTPVLLTIRTPTAIGSNLVGTVKTEIGVTLRQVREAIISVANINDSYQARHVAHVDSNSYLLGFSTPAQLKATLRAPLHPFDLSPQSDFKFVFNGGCSAIPQEKEATILLEEILPVVPIFGLPSHSAAWKFSPQPATVAVSLYDSKNNSQLKVREVMLCLYVKQVRFDAYVNMSDIENADDKINLVAENIYDATDKIKKSPYTSLEKVMRERLMMSEVTFGRTVSIKHLSLIVDKWNINVRDFTGRTILHECAASGNVEAVEFLVGIHRQGDGEQPVGTGCVKDHKPYDRHYYHIRVDEVDHNGNSALHLAVQHDCVEVVKVLLECNHFLLCDDSEVREIESMDRDYYREVKDNNFRIRNSPTTLSFKKMIRPKCGQRFPWPSSTKRRNTTKTTIEGETSIHNNENSDIDWSMTHAASVLTYLSESIVANPLQPNYSNKTPLHMAIANRNDVMVALMCYELQSFSEDNEDGWRNYLVNRGATNDNNNNMHRGISGSPTLEGELRAALHHVHHVSSCIFFDTDHDGQGLDFKPKLRNVCRGSEVRNIKAHNGVRPKELKKGKPNDVPSTSLGPLSNDYTFLSIPMLFSRLSPTPYQLAMEGNVVALKALIKHYLFYYRDPKTLKPVYNGVAPGTRIQATSGGYYYQSYFYGACGTLTMLHAAAMEGKVDMIRFLLNMRQNGEGDENMRQLFRMILSDMDSSRRTPLHYACMYGHLGAVKALIGVDDNFNDINDYDMSTKARADSAGEHHPQYLAHRPPIELGSSDGLNVHISYTKKSPNKRGNYKPTPVVDINAIDVSGRTSLHWALLKKREDVALCLLKTFAKTSPSATSTLLNASVADRLGFTPLHIAAAHGNVELIKHLVKYHHCHVDSRPHMRSTFASHHRTERSAKDNMPDPTIVVCPSSFVGKNVVVSDKGNNRGEAPESHIILTTIHTIGPTPLWCAIHGSHEVAAEALLYELGSCEALISVQEDHQVGVSTISKDSVWDSFKESDKGSNDPVWHTSTSTNLRVFISHKRTKLKISLRGANEDVSNTSPTRLEGTITPGLPDNTISSPAILYHYLRQLLLTSIQKGYKNVSLALVNILLYGSVYAPHRQHENDVHDKARSLPWGSRARQDPTLLVHACFQQQWYRGIARFKLAAGDNGDGTLRWLLDRGIGTDSHIRGDGMTALTASCYCGNTSAVQYLLERHGLLRSTTASPVLYSASPVYQTIASPLNSKHKVEILRLLIKAGASTGTDIGFKGKEENDLNIVLMNSLVQSALLGQPEVVGALCNLPGTSLKAALTALYWLLTVAPPPIAGGSNNVKYINKTIAKRVSLLLETAEMKNSMLLYRRCAKTHIVSSMSECIAMVKEGLFGAILRNSGGFLDNGDHMTRYSSINTHSERTGKRDKSQYWWRGNDYSLLSQQYSDISLVLLRTVRHFLECDDIPVTTSPFINTTGESTSQSSAHIYPIELLHLAASKGHIFLPFVHELAKLFIRDKPSNLNNMFLFGAPYGPFVPNGKARHCCRNTPVKGSRRGVYNKEPLSAEASSYFNMLDFMFKGSELLRMREMTNFNNDAIVSCVPVPYHRVVNRDAVTSFLFICTLLLRASYCPSHEQQQMVRKLIEVAEFLIIEARFLPSAATDLSGKNVCDYALIIGNQRIIKICLACGVLPRGAYPYNNPRSPSTKCFNLCFCTDVLQYLKTQRGINYTTMIVGDNRKGMDDTKKPPVPTIKMLKKQLVQKRRKLETGHNEPSNKEAKKSGISMSLVNAQTEAALAVFQLISARSHNAHQYDKQHTQDILSTTRCSTSLVITGRTETKKRFFKHHFHQEDNHQQSLNDIRSMLRIMCEILKWPDLGGQASGSMSSETSILETAEKDEVSTMGYDSHLISALERVVPTWGGHLALAVFEGFSSSRALFSLDSSPNQSSVVLGILKLLVEEFQFQMSVPVVPESQTSGSVLHLIPNAIAFGQSIAVIEYLHQVGGCAVNKISSLKSQALLNMKKCLPYASFEVNSFTSLFVACVVMNVEVVRYLITTVTLKANAGQIASDCGNDPRNTTKARCFYKAFIVDGRNIDAGDDTEKKYTIVCDDSKCHFDALSAILATTGGVSGRHKKSALTHTHRRRIDIVNILLYQSAITWPYLNPLILREAAGLDAAQQCAVNRDESCRLQSDRKILLCQLLLDAYGLEVVVADILLHSDTVQMNKNLLDHKMSQQLGEYKALSAAEGIINSSYFCKSIVTKSCATYKHLTALQIAVKENWTAFAASVLRCLLVPRFHEALERGIPETPQSPSNRRLPPREPFVALTNIALERGKDQEETYCRDTLNEKFNSNALSFRSKSSINISNRKTNVRNGATWIAPFSSPYVHLPGSLTEMKDLSSVQLLLLHQPSLSTIAACFGHLNSFITLSILTSYSKVSPPIHITRPCRDNGPFILNQQFRSALLWLQKHTNVKACDSTGQSSIKTLRFIMHYAMERNLLELLRMLVDTVMEQMPVFDESLISPPTCKRDRIESSGLSGVLHDVLFDEIHRHETTSTTKKQPFEVMFFPPLLFLSLQHSNPASLECVLSLLRKYSSSELISNMCLPLRRDKNTFSSNHYHQDNTEWLGVGISPCPENASLLLASTVSGFAGLAVKLCDPHRSILNLPQSNLVALQSILERDLFSVRVPSNALFKPTSIDIPVGTSNATVDTIIGLSASSALFDASPLLNPLCKRPPWTLGEAHSTFVSLLKPHLITTDGIALVLVSPLMKVVLLGNEDLVRQLLSSNVSSVRCNHTRGYKSLAVFNEVIKRNRKQLLVPLNRNLRHMEADVAQLEIQESESSDNSSDELHRFIERIDFFRDVERSGSCRVTVINVALGLCIRAAKRLLNRKSGTICASWHNDGDGRLLLELQNRLRIVTILIEYGVMTRDNIGVISVAVGQILSCLFSNSLSGYTTRNKDNNTSVQLSEVRDSFIQAFTNSGRKLANTVDWKSFSRHSNTIDEGRSVDSQENIRFIPPLIIAPVASSTGDNTQHNNTITMGLMKCAIRDRRHFLHSLLGSPVTPLVPTEGSSYTRTATPPLFISWLEEFLQYVMDPEHVLLHLVDGNGKTVMWYALRHPLHTIGIGSNKVCSIFHTCIDRLALSHDSSRDMGRLFNVSCDAQKGSTPLHILADCKDSSFPVYLINSPPNEGNESFSALDNNWVKVWINKKDYQGHTAVFIAAKRGNRNFLFTLMNYILSTLTNQGKHVQIEALKGVFSQCTIRGAGAMSVNTIRSPIMVAASAGHDDLVLELLQKLPQDVLQSCLAIRSESKDVDQAFSSDNNINQDSNVAPSYSSLLFCACEGGCKATIHYILSSLYMRRMALPLYHLAVGTDLPLNSGKINVHVDCSTNDTSSENKNLRVTICDDVMPTTSTSLTLELIPFIRPIQKHQTYSSSDCSKYEGVASTSSVFAVSPITVAYLLGHIECLQLLLKACRTIIGHFSMKNLECSDESVKAEKSPPSNVDVSSSPVSLVDDDCNRTNLNIPSSILVQTIVREMMSSVMSSSLGTSSISSRCSEYSLVRQMTPMDFSLIVGSAKGTAAALSTVGTCFFRGEGGGTDVNRDSVRVWIKRLLTHTPNKDKGNDDDQSDTEELQIKKLRQKKKESMMGGVDDDATRTLRKANILQSRQFKANYPFGWFRHFMQISTALRNLASDHLAQQRGRLGLLSSVSIDEWEDGRNIAVSSVVPLLSHHRHTGHDTGYCGLYSGSKGFNRLTHHQKDEVSATLAAERIFTMASNSLSIGTSSNSLLTYFAKTNNAVGIKVCSDIGILDDDTRSLFDNGPSAKYSSFSFDTSAANKTDDIYSASLQIRIPSTTALHIAAKHASIDCVQLLVRLGMSDVFSFDYKGRTPLDLALMTFPPSHSCSQMCNTATGSSINNILIDSSPSAGEQCAAYLINKMTAPPSPNSPFSPSLLTLMLPSIRNTKPDVYRHPSHSLAIYYIETLFHKVAASPYPNLVALLEERLLALYLAPSPHSLLLVPPLAHTVGARPNAALKLLNLLQMKRSEYDQSMALTEEIKAMRMGRLNGGGWGSYRDVSPSTIGERHDEEDHSACFDESIEEIDKGDGDNETNGVKGAGEDLYSPFEVALLHGNPGMVLAIAAALRRLGILAVASAPLSPYNKYDIHRQQGENLCHPLAKISISASFIEHHLMTIGPAVRCILYDLFRIPIVTRCSGFNSPTATILKQNSKSGQYSSAIVMCNRLSFTDVRLLGHQLLRYDPNCANILDTILTPQHEVMILRELLAIYHGQSISEEVINNDHSQYFYAEMTNTNMNDFVTAAPISTAGGMESARSSFPTSPYSNIVKVVLDENISEYIDKSPREKADVLKRLTSNSIGGWYKDIDAKKFPFIHTITVVIVSLEALAGDGSGFDMGKSDSQSPPAAAVDMKIGVGLHVDPNDKGHLYHHIYIGRDSIITTPLLSNKVWVSSSSLGSYSSINNELEMLFAIDLKRKRQELSAKVSNMVKVMSIGNMEGRRAGSSCSVGCKEILSAIKSLSITIDWTLPFVWEGVNKSEISLNDHTNRNVILDLLGMYDGSSLEQPLSNIPSTTTRRSIVSRLHKAIDALLSSNIFNVEDRGRGDKKDFLDYIESDLVGNNLISFIVNHVAEYTTRTDKYNNTTQKKMKKGGTQKGTTATDDGESLKCEIKKIRFVYYDADTICDVEDSEEIDAISTLSLPLTQKELVRQFRSSGKHPSSYFSEVCDIYHNSSTSGCGVGKDEIIIPFSDKGIGGRRKISPLHYGVNKRLMSKEAVLVEKEQTLKDPLETYLSPLTFHLHHQHILYHVKRLKEKCLMQPLRERILHIKALRACSNGSVPVKSNVRQTEMPHIFETFLANFRIKIEIEESLLDDPRRLSVLVLEEMMNNLTDTLMTTMVIPKLAMELPQSHIINTISPPMANHPSSRIPPKTVQQVVAENIAANLTNLKIVVAEPSITRVTSPTIKRCTNTATTLEVLNRPLHCSSESSSSTADFSSLGTGSRLLVRFSPDNIPSSADLAAGLTRDSIAIELHKSNNTIYGSGGVGSAAEKVIADTTKHLKTYFPHVLLDIPLDTRSSSKTYDDTYHTSLYWDSSKAAATTGTLHQHDQRQYDTLQRSILLAHSYGALVVNPLLKGLSVGWDTHLGAVLNTLVKEVRVNIAPVHTSTATPSLIGGCNRVIVSDCSSGYRSYSPFIFPVSSSLPPVTVEYNHSSKSLVFTFFFYYYYYQYQCSKKYECMMKENLLPCPVSGQAIAGIFLRSVGDFLSSSQYDMYIDSISATETARLDDKINKRIDITRLVDFGRTYPPLCRLRKLAPKNTSHNLFQKGRIPNKANGNYTRCGVVFHASQKKCKLLLDERNILGMPLQGAEIEKYINNEADRILRDSEFPSDEMSIPQSNDMDVKSTAVKNTEMIQLFRRKRDGLISKLRREINVTLTKPDAFSLRAERVDNVSRLPRSTRGCSTIQGANYPTAGVTAIDDYGSTISALDIIESSDEGKGKTISCITFTAPSRAGYYLLYGSIHGVSIDCGAGYIIKVLPMQFIRSREKSARCGLPPINFHPRSIMPTVRPFDELVSLSSPSGYEKDGVVLIKLHNNRSQVPGVGKNTRASLPRALCLPSIIFYKRLSSSRKNLLDSERVKRSQCSVPFGSPAIPNCVVAGCPFSFEISIFDMNGNIFSDMDLIDTPLRHKHSTKNRLVEPAGCESDKNDKTEIIVGSSFKSHSPPITTISLSTSIDFIGEGSKKEVVLSRKSGYTATLSITSAITTPRSTIEVTLVTRLLNTGDGGDYTEIGSGEDIDEPVVSMASVYLVMTTSNIRGDDGHIIPPVIQRISLFRPPSEYLPHSLNILVVVPSLCYIAQVVAAKLGLLGDYKRLIRATQQVEQNKHIISVSSAIERNTTNRGIKANVSGDNMKWLSNKQNRVATFFRLANQRSMVDRCRKDEEVMVAAGIPSIVLTPHSTLINAIDEYLRNLRLLYSTPQTARNDRRRLHHNI